MEEKKERDAESHSEIFFLIFSFPQLIESMIVLSECIYHRATYIIHHLVK